MMKVGLELIIFNHQISITKIGDIMKKVILAVFVILAALQCNGQPNTSTTLEVGVVNPQPGKHYLTFIEIKNDSSSTQLQDGMDYLAPDVSSLLTALNNIHTSADTLFGEITFQDLDHPRYLKGGSVQVDNVSLKYSGMKVLGWIGLDQIEAYQAGFFIRKK